MHEPILTILNQNTPNLIFWDNIEYSNEINTVVSTTKDDSRILKSDTK